MVFWIILSSIKVVKSYYIFTYFLSSHHFIQLIMGISYVLLLASSCCMHIVIVSLVYCTCSLLILFVLHTCLAYIRLSIIHYYLHTIYILFNLSLSHFILLTLSNYCAYLPCLYSLKFCVNIPIQNIDFQSTFWNL